MSENEAENGQPIKLPTRYELDFDKIRNVDDIVSIFKGMNFFITMSDKDFEKNSMKHLLKKIPDESTGKETSSRG